MTIKDEYIRKGKITNIVDGDTVDAVIDLGYNVFIEHRLRLLGVDTPEKGEHLWSEATAYTKERLLGKDVLIQSFKSGSFGRYLATVYIDDTTINAELLQKGLAVEFKR